MSIHIPLKEIQITFARSGGKGGQNVNKLSTRVELWYCPATSQAVDGASRIKLTEALAGRLDAQGRLRIVSQQTRSQYLNRKAAFDKLVRILEKILEPVKQRIETRAPASADDQRLRIKKLRSDIKKLRSNEGDIES